MGIELHEKTSPVKKTIALELEFETSTKDGNKEHRFEALMEMADVLDAYRLFPRAFIGVYLYILVSTINWFTGLTDPSAAQAGLISVIVGAGAAWFGLYTASGSARNPKKVIVSK